MEIGAYQKIGDLLVTKGLLTTEQQAEAVAFRERTGMRFGEVLVQLGFVTEEQVVEALSKQFAHKAVNVEKLKPQKEALGLVGYEFAIANLCLPVLCDEDTLEVVLSDPLDVETIDGLARSTRRRVRVSLATTSTIKLAIMRAYGLMKVVRSGKRGVRKQKDRAQLLDLLQTIDPAQEVAA